MKERKSEMAGARQNRTYHHHFKDQDRGLDKYAFMPTSTTCQAPTMDLCELFVPQQAQGKGGEKKAEQFACRLVPQLQPVPIFILQARLAEPFFV